MPMKVSAEEIEAKKTPKGGWTRAQLAEWGVSWPPPYKWRQALIAGLEPDTFLKRKLEQPIFNNEEDIVKMARQHIARWQERGNHELVKIFTHILRENERLAMLEQEEHDRKEFVATRQAIQRKASIPMD